MERDICILVSLEIKFMNSLKYSFLISLLISICFTTNSFSQKKISKVEVEVIHKDSVSIRAIAVDKNHLMYAGSNGKYGIYEFNEDGDIAVKKDEIIAYDGKKPSFRAVGTTKTHFFLLSIANPAVLFKIDKQNGAIKKVYEEVHEKVFYDAILFWNDQEGIAMGDPITDCLSIIITRDGGETWQKLTCDELPKIKGGEAAFAASNGNISIIGNHTWIFSGGKVSRVWYSPNKGKDWKVFDTPMINGKATTGTYSGHFYNEKLGIVYGGDYLLPNETKSNKAITQDGGKTWQLIADNDSGANYKSCVRFVPNSKGKQLVTVGFTGISISNDGGKHWKQISSESFYTLRFVNETTAYAAGKNRIAKLIFN